MHAPPPLRAAALQFNPLAHPRLLRLPALVALFEEAASQGAHLAVAPELGISPYILPTPGAAAAVAEAPRGPTFQALAPLARAAKMWIVFGFVEASLGGDLFNSAGVIDESGALITVYRKTHLFICDTWWAKAGSGPAQVQTPWGAMALGICRDIVEPDFVVEALRPAPRIFAFPTGWVPSEGDDAHSYWRAQLGDYKGVFIAADRWGEERGVPFEGRSVIMCGGGAEASLGPEGDAVITLDIL